jgi:outer membrane protein TolC
MCSHVAGRAWLASVLVVAVVALPNDDIFAAERAQLAGDAAVTGSACSDTSELQRLELADAISQSLHTQPQLIIAQQDVLEARSDVRASVAPFLPSAQLGFTDERYVPSNGSTPVVVVGNTVLGGAQTKSGYASISLSWNLMNSGRDVAGYHGARAGVRAAASGLDSQLEETLSGILQGYADLYEAEIAARGQAGATALLKAIEARTIERYQNGHGTTVAIGQARSAELDAEQSLNRDCRSLAEKSAALAAAIGIHVPAGGRLTVGEPLPIPKEIVDRRDNSLLDAVVNDAPAVAAAKQKVEQARAKLHQAQRAFGPSVSLSVRRDYLGEDPNSFGRANRSIAPSDYRIGLSFEQPLFPVATEVAAVDRARAELNKAQASFEQARLDTETKLSGALSAQREAEASYAAARASLGESRRVLELTQSLYRAGRTDLDSVQHAQIDAEKAEADTKTLASKRSSAEWAVARALLPEQFPDLLFDQLHLQVQAQRWRKGDKPDSDPSSSIPGDAQSGWPP